jgi:hypothetical protein
VAPVATDVCAPTRSPPLYFSNMESELWDSFFQIDYWLLMCMKSVMFCFLFHRVSLIRELLQSMASFSVVPVSSPHWTIQLTMWVTSGYSYRNDAGYSLEDGLGTVGTLGLQLEVTRQSRLVIDTIVFNLYDKFYCLCA